MSTEGENLKEKSDSFLDWKDQLFFGALETTLLSENPRKNHADFHLKEVYKITGVVNHALTAIHFFTAAATRKTTAEQRNLL